MDICNVYIYLYTNIYIFSQRTIVVEVTICAQPFAISTSSPAGIPQSSLTFVYIYIRIYIYIYVQLSVYLYINKKKNTYLYRRMCRNEKSRLRRAQTFYTWQSFERVVILLIHVNKIKWINFYFIFIISSYVDNYQFVYNLICFTICTLT